ncbi:MAG TPA: glycine zipper 2TM domain-containing protein [Steroidobacteraceae bacterium]
MNRTQTLRRAAATAAVVASLATLLSGCVVSAPRPAPLPPPPPPAPPPNTEVYAYPMHGQLPEQQDRDHYECSQWATQQTGFDPSAPGIPPHERVQVVSSAPPPGTGTAIGAIAGAVIGAAISPRWQAAPGALAGAVVGGAIGNASDAANAQQTRTVVVSDRRAAAAQEQQAARYRRALGACLDGRGYSVK